MRLCAFIKSVYIICKSMLLSHGWMFSACAWSEVRHVHHSDAMQWYNAGLTFHFRSLLIPRWLKKTICALLLLLPVIIVLVADVNGGMFWVFVIPYDLASTVLKIIVWYKEDWWKYYHHAAGVPVPLLYWSALCCQWGWKCCCCLSEI